MTDSLTDYAAARGKTLKELAEQVGLSESTLRRRAKSKRKPQLSKMRQLARNLGMEYEQAAAMIAAEKQAQQEDPQRKALRLPLAICRAIVTEPTNCKADPQKMLRRLKTLIECAESACNVLAALPPVQKPSTSYRLKIRRTPKKS